MPLSFHGAAATDVGTVRVNNEDTALAAPNLVVVADGMGGHAAGEVASAVVVRSLVQLLDGVPPGALEQSALEHALVRARHALRTMSVADPEMSGMGTTLVGVAATPSGPVLAHVGDSRLYRWRDGSLEALTVDHTHVQRLVETGRLAPDQVRTHPFRSVILRSLDDTSDDLPDVGPTQRVAAGDRLLLCSDGLSDYVRDEEIAAALPDGTPQEAANRLVALALARATRDNVSVVVADVLDGETPDGAAPDGVASDGVASGLVHLGPALADLALTPEAREAMERAFAEDAPSDNDPDDDDDDHTDPTDPADAPATTVRGEPDATHAVGTDADDNWAHAVETDANGSDGDAHAAAEPADPLRARDVLWLALVVVGFVAAVLTVWATGG